MSMFGYLGKPEPSKENISSLWRNFKRTRRDNFTKTTTTTISHFLLAAAAAKAIQATDQSQLFVQNR